MDDRRLARHYIGFVQDDDMSRLAARMKLHRASRGAAFLRAANERDITWHLVAVYPGDRGSERRLKQQHNSARYCPRCSLDASINPRADNVARRLSLGLPIPGPHGMVAVRDLLDSLRKLGLSQLYGELKEYE